MHLHQGSGMGKSISSMAGGRKGEEGDVHFLGGAQNFLAIFRLCVCTCTAFCTPSEA